MSNTRQQSKPLLRPKPMVEWKDTNWRKLERVVFKLQKRIYRATQRADVKAVRKLHSYINEVLVCKVFSSTKGNSG